VTERRLSVVVRVAGKLEQKSRLARPVAVWPCLAVTPSLRSVDAALRGQPSTALQREIGKALARTVERCARGHEGRLELAVHHVLSGLLRAFEPGHAGAMPGQAVTLGAVLSAYLACCTPAGRPLDCDALPAMLKTSVNFLLRTLHERDPLHVQVICAAVARGVHLDLPDADADPVWAIHRERLANDLVRAAFHLLGPEGRLYPDLPEPAALARAERLAHALVGLRDGAGARTGDGDRDREALSRLIHPALGLALRRRARSHPAAPLCLLVGAALGAGWRRRDFDKAARHAPAAPPAWELAPAHLSLALAGCAEMREGQACLARDPGPETLRLMQIRSRHEGLLDLLRRACPEDRPSDDLGAPDGRAEPRPGPPAFPAGPTGP
jgi:hypothetical protein